MLDLKHVIYDVCDIWLSCIQQTDARRNDEPVQVRGRSDTRVHKHKHTHTQTRMQPRLRARVHTAACTCLKSCRLTAMDRKFLMVLER